MVIGGVEEDIVVEATEVTPVKGHMEVVTGEVMVQIEGGDLMILIMMVKN